MILNFKNWSKCENISSDVDNPIYLNECTIDASDQDAIFNLSLSFGLKDLTSTSSIIVKSSKSSDPKDESTVILDKILTDDEEDIDLSISLQEGYDKFIHISAISDKKDKVELLKVSFNKSKYKVHKSWC